jgi:hypothetical protein
MVLRRMMGPSLETGAVLECCTVGKLLRDRDCVSAIAVTLVCDEKRAGVHSELLADLAEALLRFQRKDRTEANLEAALHPHRQQIFFPKQIRFCS